MLKVFFVDKKSIDDRHIKPITLEIEPDLDIYYELLECSMIDIVQRKIGDTYFDIICDDEGLFNEPVYVTAVNSKKEPMLVGSFIICHHDDEGNETSITEDEANMIASHLGLCLRGDGTVGSYIVCEY